MRLLVCRALLTHCACGAVWAKPTLPTVSKIRGDVTNWLEDPTLGRHTACRTWTSEEHLAVVDERNGKAVLTLGICP